MGNLNNGPACNLSQRPMIDLPYGALGLVGSEDAFSLVGQQAHLEARHGCEQSH